MLKRSHPVAETERRRGSRSGASRATEISDLRLGRKIFRRVRGVRSRPVLAQLSIGLNTNTLTIGTSPSKLTDTGRVAAGECPSVAVSQRTQKMGDVIVLSTRHD